MTHVPHGSIVSRLFCLTSRALSSTYRYRFHGSDHLAEAARLGGGSYLLAIWHQNLLAGILAQTGSPHTVMVSRSHHADPVAYTCGRLGHHVARGGSRSGKADKGGREARDEMIDLLRSGLPGAVTVDGPRGPAHEVKPGIVAMARSAGIPVVPYFPIAEHYWSFNSWDRFRVPLPFSRVHVHYGSPLSMPLPAEGAECNFEAQCLRVGEALQALERQAGYGPS